jgi:hypothetical protein
MRERTFFEADAERAVVKHTTELLNALDRLALRHDVDKRAVEAACHRFSGPDLADCWADYIADAEL